FSITPSSPPPLPPSFPTRRSSDLARLSWPRHGLEARVPPRCHRAISRRLIEPCSAKHQLASAHRRQGVRTLWNYGDVGVGPVPLDRKSTRLNSSHSQISYAVFCLK